MLTFAAFALVLAPLQWKGFGPDSRFPYLPGTLNLAYREGVLAAYPDDEVMGRGRAGSRYVYTIAVHAIVQNSIRLSETALSMRGNDVQRASLLRFGDTLPSYALAGREFRKESDSLGVEKGFGLKKLGGLLTQIRESSPAKDRLFSDVPVDHWAAKAVGDLRALGLLERYPDGRFRG